MPALLLGTLLLLASAASLGAPPSAEAEEDPISQRLHRDRQQQQLASGAVHDTNLRFLQEAYHEDARRLSADRTDGSVSPPVDWSSDERVHGMIIDAGSSGSRMHVSATLYVCVCARACVLATCG